MAELPDAIYAQVTELSDQGSQAFDRGEFEQALSVFTRAWEMLPEPRTEWKAGVWILAGQGDCLFFLCRFREAREIFIVALNADISDTGNNTFAHLRLGEIDCELGNLDSAAQYLMRAFMLGGHELLASEDPKYGEFLRTRAVLDDA
jgi:tetratricopeptide (TPR) repeat protein